MVLQRQQIIEMNGIFFTLQAMMQLMPLMDINLLFGKQHPL
jgi:hypothetical protein